jgi:hypothetical protein
MKEIELVLNVDIEIGMMYGEMIGPPPTGLYQDL